VGTEHHFPGSLKELVHFSSVSITSLLLLRQQINCISYFVTVTEAEQKCIGYIVTVTEGAVAMEAAATEAAATGEAATGAANKGEAAATG
jgi:hypothetical protein